MNPSRVSHDSPPKKYSRINVLEEDMTFPEDQQSALVPILESPKNSASKMSANSTSQYLEESEKTLDILIDLQDKALTMASRDEDEKLSCTMPTAGEEQTKNKEPEKETESTNEEFSPPSLNEVIRIIES